jgi:squalene synthase HpnD
MSSSASTIESTDAPAAQRASGSSFYLAMRILPQVQRDAMFEIYSFCRKVDDIADSDAPRPQRVTDLAAWRADIDALYAGNPPPPLRGLAQAVQRFGLRKEDFEAVIEGMEMDALEDIRAPDFATLDLYCDRVASAVGRLSVRVFGMNESDGRLLAHHLGRALQLTNILRDIDEDAGIGRLYLPYEALHAAGISSTDPDTVIAHPAIGKVCEPVVERAREHFEQAQIVMARWPRKVVRAPQIMGNVYRAMLDGMVARGWAPPRERVRLGKPRLAWLVLRGAFF